MAVSLTAIGRMHPGQQGVIAKALVSEVALTRFAAVNRAVLSRNLPIQTTVLDTRSRLIHILQG